MFKTLVMLQRYAGGMTRSPPMRRTTILTTACVLFLVGLGYARKAPVMSGWVVAGLAMLLVILLVTRLRFGLVVGLPLVFFVGGWYRGQVVLAQARAYDSIIGKTVEVEGVALDDAVYSERGQLEFTAGSLSLRAPPGNKLIGEIDVEGMGVPMIYRGDRLVMNGRLFRKRGGQLAGMSFGKLSVVSRSHSPIDVTRRRFAVGMYNVLPDQLASFGMGLLIGQRTTLDKTLSDELVTVGLIHIVAVSGYNLTIIIDVVRRLLRRRSRYQTVILSLLLIATFLLLTGFSPSIVRAGVVSSISLVMWYWGRAVKPLLLLTFVAALTAGVNPLYLWSNIGWYLSFTAFFGVMIVGPLLNTRFLPGKLSENIVLATLSETIAAQVCTVPIILYIFGRLSIISVLANIMVVPLTPLAMLLSMLAGAVGMVQLIFGRLVVIPTQVILDYMLTISRLLSRVPYANIEVHLTTAQMVVLYLVLLGWVVILQVKSRQKSAIITEIEEPVHYVRTQQMVNN